MICHGKVWSIKIQDVDYLCNACVRMCLILHFACTDTMLVVDLEAKNPISYCLEGYSIFQIKEGYFPIYFNLFLRTGYTVKER